MRRSFAEWIVSIFLGASWAIIAIGAFIGFSIYQHHSLTIAIAAGFGGLFVGLFFVLVFESMAIFLENGRELKRQTKLLEEIKSELSSKIPHH